MTPESPKQPSNPASPKNEEEKKKGGVLPPTGGKEMPSFLKSASSAASSPMLRVRGGLGAGTNIVERLKSLRKKDLAFIGAGLMTLVMAPLAEHFMMSPDDKSAAMTSGFASNASFPGDVGSIYDPGAGGFSPGGLLGQGSDVITPLNVRDPSALIMGPGATQKPAATVEASASAAKPVDNSAWKDALAAAQKGASAATQKARLPMPGGKLAAGMRGLGAVSGSGGGMYTLPGLSASNVPNKAAGSGSLTRAQAAPGYRGAASRSGAAGGNEGMKAAGGRQADLFNKGGSAGAALEQAAKEAIPGGHPDTGNRPGGGEEAKAPGHADPKSNKSLGESLAFLKQKMEMEKQMELRWKKKMWNEFERQKMIEETVIKSALENIVGKGIFEPIGKALGDAFGSLTGGGPQGYSCICANSAKCGTASFTKDVASFRKMKGEKPGWPEEQGYQCIAWPGTGAADVPAKDPNMSGTDVASGGLTSTSGNNASLIGKPRTENGQVMGGQQALSRSVQTSRAEAKVFISGCDKAGQKEYSPAFCQGVKTADGALDAQEKMLGQLKTAQETAAKGLEAVAKATARLQDELKQTEIANNNLGTGQKTLQGIVEKLNQKKAEAFDGTGAQPVLTTALKSVEGAAKSFEGTLKNAGEANVAMDEAKAKLTSARETATLVNLRQTVADPTFSEGDRYKDRYDQLKKTIGDVATDGEKVRSTLQQNITTIENTLAVEVVPARKSSHEDATAPKVSPTALGDSSAGNTAKAIEELKRLSAAGDTNPIVAAAKKKYEETVLAPACAASKDTCLATYNKTDLPAAVAEAMKKYDEGLAAAVKSHKEAKTAADAIGTSAK